MPNNIYLADPISSIPALPVETAEAVRPSVFDFGLGYLIQVIDEDSPFYKFIGCVYRIGQLRLSVNFNYNSYEFTPMQLKIIRGGDITLDHTCNSCGEVLNQYHSNFFVNTNQINFCSGCHSALYAACAHCHQYVLKSETVTDLNGVTCCRQCHDHFSSLCGGCGNRFNVNLWSTTTDDILYCVTCRRDYNTCRSCCRVIVSTEDERVEGEYIYCSSCFSRRPVIEDYNYKPAPHFYTATVTTELQPFLYLGVELEVDDGGYTNRHAREVKDSLPFAYLKSDGSLNNGFEIVTHPCTLAFHEEQKEKYVKTFRYLLNNNYQSHQTDTCGFHIHINRDFFGDDGDDQELGEAKLLYLIEKFWTELVNFSRRKQRELDHWARRAEDYDPVNTMLENLNNAKGHGRYYALNFENIHTIEFRLFKGTLNLETFLGTLQLIDLLTRYALENTPEQLQATSWEDLFKDCNHQELMTYLKKRHLLNTEGEEL